MIRMVYDCCATLKFQITFTECKVTHFICRFTTFYTSLHHVLYVSSPERCKLKLKLQTIFTYVPSKDTGTENDRANISTR